MAKVSTRVVSVAALVAAMSGSAVAQVAAGPAPLARGDALNPRVTIPTGIRAAGYRFSVFQP